MKILSRLLVLILFFMSPSFADRINVFEFTETELLNLKVRKVRGADNKTKYSVGSNDNGNYLKAIADVILAILLSFLSIGLKKYLKL